MSISTKTGDSGETSLWSGERVKKNNIRVETYGTIDELNSFLGEAKHFIQSEKIKSIILEIQGDLFKVGGELASTKQFKYPILESDVERITRYVHELESEVTLKGFVIPGETLPAAKLDICRTIARRAERCIITLDDSEPVSIPLKQYINRLSDLLFIMARRSAGDSF